MIKSFDLILFEIILILEKFLLVLVLKIEKWDIVSKSLTPSN